MSQLLDFWYWATIQVNFSEETTTCSVLRSNGRLFNGYMAIELVGKPRAYDAYHGRTTNHRCSLRPGLYGRRPWERSFRQAGFYSVEFTMGFLLGWIHRAEAKSQVVVWAAQERFVSSFYGEDDDWRYILHSGKVLSFRDEVSGSRRSFTGNLLNPRGHWFPRFLWPGTLQCTERPRQRCWAWKCPKELFLGSGDLFGDSLAFASGCFFGFSSAFVLGTSRPVYTRLVPMTHKLLPWPTDVYTVSCLQRNTQVLAPWASHFAICFPFGNRNLAQFLAQFLRNSVIGI